MRALCRCRTGLPASPRHRRTSTTLLPACEAIPLSERSLLIRLPRPCHAHTSHAAKALDALPLMQSESWLNVRCCKSCMSSVKASEHGVQLLRVEEKGGFLPTAPPSPPSPLFNYRICYRIYAMPAVGFQNPSNAPAHRGVFHSVCPRHFWQCTCAIHATACTSSAGESL